MFMPGEFSVMNTSAGDALPSATSWFAISRSLPLRIWTLTPLALLNSSAQACVKFSCCAL